jgi:hypothetical protein
VGRPFFLEQFLHGSPFVTNLRLDWIVEFSVSKNAPEGRQRLHVIANDFDDR